VSGPTECATPDRAYAYHKRESQPVAWLDRSRQRGNMRRLWRQLDYGAIGGLFLLAGLLALIIWH
jgi:hypothetical protein